MRYSERELSVQRGKTTVLDRHEIRLRVPHVLFLLLHRQPGTPYRYIFALWRNSLPLSVNLSHISSSLLILSSHPAPAPLIRYTILALYKFICMYVCMLGLVAWRSDSVVFRTTTSYRQYKIQHTRA